MKLSKGKIIAALVILALLAGAWFWGGNYPGRERTGSPPAPAAPAAQADQGEPGPEEEKPPVIPAEPEPEAEPDPEPGPEPPVPAIDQEAGQDQDQTDPAPTGQPGPVEPPSAGTGETAYTCTISISCPVILDNLDMLDEEKQELIPADGIILPATTATFYEGESVFNVLQRTCKQQGLHLEFVNTPIYNSAYIEGINNIYEFEVGELSGWMYKVNGWFPNYGCSSYQLADGDVIEWVYTCDQGQDVGGGYASAQGQKEE